MNSKRQRLKSYKEAEDSTRSGKLLPHLEQQRQGERIRGGRGDESRQGKEEAEPEWSDEKRTEHGAGG